MIESLPWFPTCGQRADKNQGFLRIAEVLIENAMQGDTKAQMLVEKILSDFIHCDIEEDEE